METKYDPRGSSPTPPPYSVAKDMEQDYPTKGGAEADVDQGYTYPRGYSNVPTQPQYSIYPPTGANTEGPQVNYPPQKPPLQQPQLQAPTYVITNQPMMYNEITVGGPIDAPKPPSYMCFSIVVCLCCSCLFGLIAIAFSCKSDSSYGAGHVENARIYGQRAKSFGIIGIVTSVIFSVIYLLFSWLGFIDTPFHY